MHVWFRIRVISSFIAASIFVLLGATSASNGHFKRSKMEIMRTAAVVTEAEITSEIGYSAPFVGDPYTVDIKWVDQSGKTRTTKHFNLDVRSADSVMYAGELFNTKIDIAYVPDRPDLKPMSALHLQYQKNAAGFRFFLGLGALGTGLFILGILSWSTFFKKAT